MKLATLIIRVLMGLGFVVFGLNILHPFLAQPPMAEGTPMTQFATVMSNSGWMKLVGFFQLLGGLLVLSGRMAPLGLVILGAVLVNIIACHVYLMGGEGLMPGLVFSAFEVFLVYAYRKNFTGIFTATARLSDQQL